MQVSHSTTMHRALMSPALVRRTTRWITTSATLISVNAAHLKVAHGGQRETKAYKVMYKPIVGNTRLLYFTLLHIDLLSCFVLVFFAQGPLVKEASVEHLVCQESQELVDPWGLKEKEVNVMQNVDDLLMLTIITE